LERKKSSSQKQSLHEPPEGQGRNLANPQSPLGLVFSIALSIFVYEVILILLFLFFPSLSGWLKTLMDPTLLVVFLSPTLYFFLFRPMTRHMRERERAEERLKDAQEELEIRVRERTAELAEKNEELRLEIQRRRQADEKLSQEFRVNAALSELYAPLISPSSSIESITKVILDRAKALTGSEHGYVSSIDPITGDAVGHTLTEMLKDKCRLPEEENKIVFPRGADGLYRGLWGHALNTGEAFFTNLPATHEASEGVPQGHVPIQCFLSVPVLLGEEIVGQIALANKGEDYTKQDLGSIRRVAGYYALAIQQNRAKEDLQKAKEELEMRIEARTLDLAKANARLRAEVSERIQTEEQIEQSKETLQGIFDGISEPLILMDAQMKVKMLNRAATDYYGMNKPRDLIEGTCHQLLREGLTPCEGCEVPEAISSGKSTKFERKGFMDPDRLEHLYVYPIKGKDGQGRDVLLRISDITEQRLFEKQLIHSEKLASLGTLVSSIAHEINNPNSFITMNIPILRDFLETLIPIADRYAERHPDLELCHMPYPEFRKDILALLDNIQHGADRIYRVVSNLREFSQVKGKKEEKWVDLKSVIDKSLSLCGVKIGRAVESFITDIPKDLPKVYTDPYSLEQIIVNLLVNAADASDKRDSWIKLSVAVNDTWLNHTIIEVSDNGHGMDEEVREKIFDPFVTSKSRSDGTGLGLYVCYNLAEALRGRIEVESEPGKGSIFRVMLPDKERRQKRRV
jgi:signal transduction histidine kinase/GAF domain-containing protein